MNCLKHKIMNIPCVICAKEEYELYKNDSKHDFTELKKFLRSNGIEA